MRVAGHHQYVLLSVSRDSGYLLNFPSCPVSLTVGEDNMYNTCAETLPRMLHGKDAEGPIYKEGCYHATWSLEIS